MKICVVGLWHLGTVTAACLAHGGHTVVGFDPDPTRVQMLQAGHLPVEESGLQSLIQQGREQGLLTFCAEPSQALADAEVVWITYDTPVDEEDQADVPFVIQQTAQLFPYLSQATLLLLSSQIPVGTTAVLEERYRSQYPQGRLSFGYVPENLRLGKAIAVFTEPDRVVVGLRDPAQQARVIELFAPFTNQLQWMGVESAEMTKHALNAFLAMSVTFINEIATLCEQVGADAKEVERGLKSESRIGPGAYLAPGVAFAGGTLARDIIFLNQLGTKKQQVTPLLTGVLASNQAHKAWIKAKLQPILAKQGGARVAVWGLTYKPGTNTLRRSSAVELGIWIAQQGGVVQAHDPAIQALPDELASHIKLYENVLEALTDADVLVIATEWPEYRAVDIPTILDRMGSPTIIDPNHFLEDKVMVYPKIKYFAVGKNAS